MRQEIPVYFFTGFLEAGKTRYIQETLCDPRFNGGEKTLLLVCEEGVEEYDPSAFASSAVRMVTVEDPEELNEQFLRELQEQYSFTRVVLEYNGMWPMQTLFDALPRNWIPYQNFMFADATTFANYNANMRGLVVDKLQAAELVIFNRVSEAVDTMALHKIVRGVTRRADIAYEHTDGSVEYDDIEDPLPFDTEAPVIEIADRDYALWYRDLTEEMKKYAGKTVRFKGIVATDPKFPKNSFAIGRHVMTCCADDITYAGLACDWSGAATLSLRDWVIVTAKISIGNHKIYGRKGPVLTVLDLARSSRPEEEVATFY